MASVEGRLGAPAQTGEIGIFAILGGASVGLVGLTLCAPLFLFTLLHLARFLAITFCNSCFACSSDEALLGIRRTRARSRATRWRHVAVCDLKWLHQRLIWPNVSFASEFELVPAPSPRSPAK